MGNTPTKRGKLTEADQQVLRLVADGEYLGYGALDALYRLERDGLIEQIKTGFISQVSLRITPAGRSALTEAGHD